MEDFWGMFAPRIFMGRYGMDNFQKKLKILVCLGKLNFLIVGQAGLSWH